MNTLYPGDKFLGFREIVINAGSWDYPASDPAPLDTDTGTNGTIKRHLFDDTTEEQLIQKIHVPEDIDTNGTVTFIEKGYSVTAVSSKNVEFTFYHSAAGDSDSWDVAFTSEVSGDILTDATQDDINIDSWTETASNLGWAAGEQVRIKLGRTAPSANDLVGDYGLTQFVIRIPVVPTVV